MQDNNTNKWKQGFQFVQFMKNKAYDSRIKRNPFNSMIKTDLKLAYRQVYCYTLYYKKYHQLKIEKANKEKNDQMHELT